MTRREFCEHHQIPLTTLDSWKRAESSKRGTQRLLPVQIETGAASNESQGPGFTLSLANGRRIECGWNFTDLDIARLIRAAENA